MKVILTAHGELSTQFHKTLEMIVGEVNHFTPVNFYPDDGPEQLRARIEESLDMTSDEEYIIFTDLFGGTPFNVSSGMSAENPNISVVAGMNLPMLLELAFALDGDREDLVDAAMESAKNGVKKFVYVERVESNDLEDEDSF